MTMAKKVTIPTLVLALAAADHTYASEDPIKANPNTGANFNRYAYANNNPYKYTDPDGRDAKWIVHKDGTNTLQIPVMGVGPGATPEVMYEIERRVESLKLPDPRTRIDVQLTSSPGKGVNTLQIGSGLNSMCKGSNDCTNRLGGNKAYVDMNLANFKGAAAHEIMHFPGLPDQYQYVNKDGIKTIEPKAGYDKSNIMVMRSGSQLTESQLREAFKNETTEKIKEEDAK